MVLTSVREGDIVKVNIRGDEFYGLVKGKERGALTVYPISVGRGSANRRVTSRQVVHHWRHRRVKVPTEVGGS